MSRDYWPSDPSTDVNLLESRALLNALVSFKGHLSNSRGDVHIDNDGCRNSAINEVVKEIYRYSRDQNLSIQTFYVPSSSNPADEPSRGVRIWTVCFLSGLGYLWNACSVLIHSI